MSKNLLNNPTYLGDGVYVEFDGYHIKLTTSDGISDTNTIYLDNNVTISFETWLKEFKQKMLEDENAK